MESSALLCSCCAVKLLFGKRIKAVCNTKIKGSQNIPCSNCFLRFKENQYVPVSLAHPPFERTIPMLTSSSWTLMLALSSTESCALNLRVKRTSSCSSVAGSSTTWTRQSTKSSRPIALVLNLAPLRLPSQLTGLRTCLLSSVCLAPLTTQWLTQAAPLIFWLSSL